jgi:hypothetical protein
MIHTGLALPVFIRLVASAPQYERKFMDFNMVLPGITVAFLHLSHLLQPPLLPFLGLIVVLAVDGVILRALGGWSQRDGQAWFWAVVALLILTWGTMEYALNYPLYLLFQALSR